VRLMYNSGAVLLGMVYNFLPFMVFPVYTSLSKLDPKLGEAAQDLGCNEWKTFTKVTAPLSLPGVISGITMVFMPCISTFVISDMLSRNTIQLFGNLINQAYKMDQWNYAAALSTLMLVIIFFSTVITGRMSKEEENKSLW
jgi:spermidine/putrescine transport system permease protein